MPVFNFAIGVWNNTSIDPPCLAAVLPVLGNLLCLNYSQKAMLLSRTPVSSSVIVRIIVEVIDVGVRLKQ